MFDEKTNFFILKTVISLCLQSIFRLSRARSLQKHFKRDNTLYVFDALKTVQNYNTRC